MGAEVYLIIDKRSFVGNDVLFWNRNGSGYTTDIDKAQKYNRTEAQKLDAGRTTDIAVLFDDMEKLSRRVVDMQYVDREVWDVGYSCFDQNASESKTEKIQKMLENKMDRLGNLFDDADTWLDDWGMSEEDVVERIRKEANKIINEKVIG